MTDHGARAHATWSASSTARNWACSGALALGRLAPPDKESLAAATGTACHQIAEKCLRDNLEPISFLDTVEKTKARDIKVDEDLVNSAEMYVTYVREAVVAGGPGTVLMIEQRFSLADLKPPFDAGGTGDAVIYYPSARVLEVVDLKNGMGVVEARGNPQLRTYGLGAVLANPQLDIDAVKVTIVQPRAEHRDGYIRSETIGVAELLDWTIELTERMRAAKDAIDARDAAGSNSVLLDEWADKYLSPGACKFCPAEGFCPALRKRAIDERQGVANVWFADGGEPRISNQPDAMSPEELARTLDLLPLLEDWAKAVRSYAHTLAEGGTKLPGYFLAEKIGNRRWKDEAAALAALRQKLSLSDDDIFAEPAMKSVAQIEKVLGSKRKKEIESLYERPVTGRNLVSAAKSTRPEAKSTVDKYFHEGA